MYEYPTNHLYTVRNISLHVLKSKIGFRGIYSDTQLHFNYI